MVTYVKCPDESKRKKQKSPFSTTTLSFDAPSPANPSNYLHKPYTARNCVPWATFFDAESVCVALQVSKQFCLKARIRQTIRCRTLEYMALYVTVWKMYSERKKRKSPFSITPLSLLQRSPANICIKLTLLETRIPGVHFGG